MFHVIIAPDVLIDETTTEETMGAVVSGVGVGEGVGDGVAATATAISTHAALQLFPSFDSVIVPLSPEELLSAQARIEYVPPDGNV